MRDGIRRSVNAHRGEQDAVADLKRLDQIAAMCDAASVGHEVRPDIQTGETR